MLLFQTYNHFFYKKKTPPCQTVWIQDQIAYSVQCDLDLHCPLQITDELRLVAIRFAPFSRLKMSSTMCFNLYQSKNLRLVMG